jgi:hypothetical protein
MEDEINNDTVLLEINKLREDVSDLNEKIKILESLLIKISVSAEKMDSHIDFITNTYDTFKTPLYYVKNTVDRLVGNSFNKNNTITDTSNDVLKSE